VLLDAVLPEFDFGHRHAVIVPASPSRVADAAEQYSIFGDAPWFVRVLFRLRGTSTRGVPRHGPRPCPC